MMEVCDRWSLSQTAMSYCGDGCLIALELVLQPMRLRFAKSTGIIASAEIAGANSGIFVDRWSAHDKPEATSLRIGSEHCNCSLQTLVAVTVNENIGITTLRSRDRKSE